MLSGIGMAKPRKLWLLIGGLLVLASLLAVLICQPGVLLPLPSAVEIRDRTLAQSTLILDRNGRLLYEIVDPHAGAHRPLELDEIPLVLRQAIIATEDVSFYRNPGVDLRAIVRALWINLRSGRTVSGASTITQQLARNVLLGSQERYEKSWSRKVREAVLAYHMTRTMSKDEILALYLNETYFGNMAYGVEAAAQACFGKPASQLDLAECSMLAGLPQAPEAYNPLSNLTAARGRQSVVLDLMVKAGHVTREQAELARQEPLRFAANPFGIEAPHFCMMVRDELARRLGEETLRRGGLLVHTTLDLGLQHAAESHVKRHLARLNEQTDQSPGHNVQNAAVVVLDHRDGAILAMVGSPDYFDARISGAVNTALALRQPGSAIKPLTYAAAFARGYSPAAMMTDVRTSFLTREGTPYVPINYDYRFHGPVTLRRALACSYNVIAVKLLDEMGVQALVSTAHKLGITSLDEVERQGLALTLGGCEVRLIELTAAFGALANGGYRVDPRFIDYVEDAEGKVIYRSEARPSERVVDPRVSYLVTDVLSDDRARVPAFGEGSVLDMPFPAAVKTGTTTGWRDNWTLGYTTDLVTGVWVGNADNQSMTSISGVSGAAPIWHAVMSSAHSSAPRPFPRPPGLLEVVVCAESGQLPGPACTHRKKEIFLPENAPVDTCQMHRLVALDAATGEVAASDCPPERRVYRRLTYWPPEALLWAEEEGLPLPPSVAEAHRVAPQPIDVQGDAGRGPLAATDAETASSGLNLASPFPNSSYLIAPDIPSSFQRIEIAAVCAPELGLSDLSLWIDGQRWHTWHGPPYRVFWTLVPGSHTFRLEGVTSQRQTASSPLVHIRVEEASATIAR
ncbi:MAG TPA: PBP1A family penicillin-binding protein [Anaerolineae bacterium]|nr:PBP1A family penicillin-binding protein [Anaerolineae bacterium]